MDPVGKKAGIGVIVRNHQGNPIITEWKFIPGCASAEDAEALSCLEGLKHLITLNGQSSILESDCLRAVQVLTSVSMDKSNSWCTYSEGRELLNLYNNISVSKVDRVCNSVAHSLAQLGKSGTSGCLAGSAPPCVMESIHKDCNTTLSTLSSTFLRHTFPHQVPKRIVRFLTRRRACLIFCALLFKKKTNMNKLFEWLI
jgi:ribonuclease HI